MSELDKRNYIVKSLSKGTHKKYETFVVNQIYAGLYNPNLEIVTQQHVLTKEGKIKYIDLYFPQINYGIEVDEPYHDDEKQKLRDKEREEKIEEAILESVIVETNRSIKFIRITISENETIESLIKTINKTVDEIKKEITKLKKPLIWNYGDEEVKKDILERGYLKRDDSLTYMADIIRLFGVSFNGNSYQRCTKWLDKNEKYLIWSPTLSFRGSNKSGWINTISNDLNFIYETGTQGKEKTEHGFIWDRENNVKRIVFMKFKDALGNRKRKFLGVYVADSYDKDTKTEVWKFVSDSVRLDINK